MTLHPFQGVVRSEVSLRLSTQLQVGDLPKSGLQPYTSCQRLYTQGERIEAMQATAEQIAFNDNLRRARGRTSRNYIASARVTKTEQNELETAARVQGKALSEWCREILLAAARNETITPAFTEIIAIRQLLNAVLRHIACGGVMTPEQFQAEVQGIRASKHKAAADVMQQYAATEERK